MTFIITKTLEEHTLEAMEQVNKLAGDKILEKYPLYKQTNLQTSWLQLVYADTQPGTLPLTNQNSPEGLSIQQDWAWIKTIRDLSNTTIAGILIVPDIPTLYNLMKTYKDTLSTFN